ncbi:protease modulator HflC [Parasutterella secunda]|uniref:protease modulator HflC n=1 Tax=Parasutterella secunda TaxID=626947 RepID=UPI0025A322A7|nr:protease modulator HflC [Parasutterella secunda]MDM8086690.1 protease modulator HflC [Parasutterella secunda]
MKKLSTAALVVLVALAAAKLCLYTVNEREHALVFALGELKEVVSEPGLHAKLPPPFQNVVYLDKRILTLDAPTADLVQTSEKKNLMIDSFVKWRIANPRLYWVSFHGNERAAEDRISALLRDALNQTVNKRTVNGITSRERDVAMLEIRTGLQERVKDVGVEVVDVRLKRVDFTPEISESVYRRMEAERKRVAAEERSTGAAEAEKIRADADRQRAVILAQAYNQAQQIKGEGDAIANATYAQAFSKNAEFARFYRNLEAYRASFANKKDVMVVDPSADFFKYMKEPEAK